MFFTLDEFHLQFKGFEFWSRYFGRALPNHHPGPDIVWVIHKIKKNYV